MHLAREPSLEVAVPVISAPHVLIGGRQVGPRAVVVEGGRVVEVTDVPPPGPDHVELTGGFLTPGMVELQLNGALGVDFARAQPEDWPRIRAWLATTGVTAFQPTVITAELDDIVASIEAVAAARERAEATPGEGARILGVHVEGPFLSPRRPGVHPPELMRLPTPERVQRLLDADAGRHVLTMITLAPELEGALDAIRAFREAGVVVSLGHSDATGEQARAGFEAGATAVTHLFNAQRPLGHREPGLPGQAMAEPGVTVGLIPDLHHVSPEIVRVVMNAKSGEVALVTDALAAVGMPPGRYELGGIEVELGGPGELLRNLDGTIAGSSITLDEGVRRVVHGAGVGVEDALHAATRVPADAVGRDDLGRIEPGACADLVWWDDELRPQRTWVAGLEVPRAD